MEIRSKITLANSKLHGKYRHCQAKLPQIGQTHITFQNSPEQEGPGQKMSELYQTLPCPNIGRGIPESSGMIV